VAPGTFEELVKKTSLARTTLSEGLAELETAGRLECKTEPPKKRGRGQRHRIVYQLVKSELAPVAKALRHLGKIGEIDTELGRKLLTKPVVKAMIDISNLYYGSDAQGKNCQIRSELDLDPGGRAKPEFNELTLLKALARYNIENCMVPHSPNGSFKWGFLPGLMPLCPFPCNLPHYLDVKMTPDEYDKWLKSNVLPGIKFLINKNFLKKFDKLMVWIRPLIEVGGMRTDPINRPCLWNEVVPSKKNLAAIVVSANEKDYLDFVLWPLWEAKKKELPMV
jgi:hypothetical protein